MTTILEFPTKAAPRERGESAEVIVDAVLRTRLTGIRHAGKLEILAAGAKQIRDLFRELGWSKYFRVTKGCWTLGPKIEWATGYKPSWECDETRERRRERMASSAYSPPPYCTCTTCTYRRAQQEAVRRRVAYVLNAAFHEEGKRSVGDHSDTMTDYFDADYTFYA